MEVETESVWKQMLCSVLKDVTLGADGNIVATYMDAANGGTEWVTSPSNMAQYVVTRQSIALVPQSAGYYGEC